MGDSHEATQALVEVSAGRRNSADELLPMVYVQLHGLAERYMNFERSDHTLQPTALVHEVYLRLVDDSKVDWKGRTHFLAVAARAMQRVLIDHARGRDRQKRGGKWRRVSLNDAFQLNAHSALDALALADAMARMRTLDERQARVAELRVYSGLTDAEIGLVLGVSERTIEREWKMARAWLRRELNDHQHAAPQRDAAPSDFEA